MELFAKKTISEFDIEWPWPWVTVTRNWLVPGLCSTIHQNVM